MTPWLLPPIGFLIGSIPFGLLIAKAKGINILEHGSGNIGATNVLRTVGKGAGILCFALDVLKGFLPVLLATNLVRFDGRDPIVTIGFLTNLTESLPVSEQFSVQLIHVLTALATILGHNYSPWIGFKGGKGIATTGGAILGLMPFAVIVLTILWGVLFLCTRYVSLASILVAAALPVMTHLGARYHHLDNDKSQPTLWESGTWNKPLFYFTLFAGVMAIWKHRANIKRLLNGTEHRFSKRKNTT
jgi:glycerol-3-phosphate acyltransferase PlsY